MKSHQDVLPLYEEGELFGRGLDGFRPFLELHLLAARRPAGAVVIFPGGGYAARAPHEGAPVARAFNAQGFHAWVAHYRVAPNRHPAPLQDAARAVQCVRRHAAAWNVNPTQVAVLGFSAGGHLAASLGVHFETPWVRVPRPGAEGLIRPDALILGYPVITSGPTGHRSSFDNLLGPDAPDSLRREMSLELHVTSKTPPTFLWHTADDSGVPVENSLLFSQALRRHGVPFELHVYARGRHGLGLASEDPHVASWVMLAAQWLRLLGWETASP